VIVVDTGLLVALLDADDRHHGRSRAWLAENEEPMVVPVPVITETCYFVERDSGPLTEAEFLASFESGGTFERADLHAQDWIRVGVLLRAYADLPLGVVDASVVAVAERLGISQIATFDHRHFTVVRPNHVASFDLHP
jgi:uncharacterized protein